uniref:BolA-like protein 1 n=1 Tax=Sus scrofa TaxID=9823 RepID=A0A8D1UUS0_PIG
MMRVFLLSRAALPASSRISAVRYSSTAAMNFRFLCNSSGSQPLTTSQIGRSRDYSSQKPSGHRIAPAGYRVAETAFPSVPQDARFAFGSDPQPFLPGVGTAVFKPECKPMLSGQLVGRLFSMAGRVCLSRSSTGAGTIGPVEAAIRMKLEQALNPEVLELRNESGGHAVPPGSETHFRVAVVSSRFEGLSPLQRHRLVHTALSEELAGPVHALAIQARTPAQWRENPQLDTSPPCLGGSKKTRGTP